MYKELLDNAVRDICAVSVTAAPKSEVKRILENLLTHTIPKEKLKEKLEGIRDSVDKRYDWEKEKPPIQEFIRGKGWGCVEAVAELLEWIKE